jgi:FlaA1/EpsC-like NDP-sugar epimerase
MKGIFSISFWTILDIVFINISLIVSFILRFGMDWRAYLYTYREFFLHLSISFLLFAVIFKLYRRIWRYLSIGDLFLIAEVVTVGIFAPVLYLNILKGFYLPRTIAVLTWFFSLALVGGSRLIWRVYCERKGSFKKGEERILIVGAGDAGEVISREIIRRPDLGELIGFVDDDKEKIGKRIHNRKVLGSVEEINDILEKEEVDTVIISIPTASGKQIRKIINSVKVKEVKIKTLPGLYELVDGKVSVSRIREVRVEDLLGREPIDLNIEKILENIKDKKVMITGGAGSIGQEITKQLCKFIPGELMLLDHSENGLFYISRELEIEWPDSKVEIIVTDIRNRGKMEKIFRKYKPNIVFHAAAHKHVPIMEYHPDEAVSNNIIGTKNVAELSDKFGVERFVMISTDKAINPTSVMGASKRVAEMIVKDLGSKSKTRFVAVRFGNVLESSGSVIPILKKQILEGGPITVTDKEMKRYFMTVSEASQLVIQAGILSKGGEVFVLDMGEPMKVLDLAKELIRLSGFEPDEDIEIKFVGLRPGEKLFEEILTEEERSRVLGDSGHERIFIAKVDDVEGERLERDIRELEVLAKEMDSEGIVKKLQEIVPSYKPNRDMLM